MKVKEFGLKAYHNLFNLKLALASFVFNGLLEATVHWHEDSATLLEAMATQATASFFLTGITARVVQHFSPLKNVWLSYTLGSLIPAALTFGGSYLFHYVQGTPRLIISCLPATGLSLTSSLATNYFTRNRIWKKFVLPPNYPAT
ncbi:MAG: hypothetical protein Q8P32_01075 [Candidatus Komeilibacteria bacterium]|nr:hypothetical protein [Candidatus Komeilibacteria bacterium]